MKIETALRYASEIARRLNEEGGIVETPGCGHHRAMQIDAVWVFGSTIKGSDSPNDLDILIDMKELGPRLHWQEVGYDKTYFRNHGLYRANPAYYEALKWLSKGMKKVSRHMVGCFDNEESLKKAMIYPRFELCPVEILKVATSGYVKEVYDDRTEADIKITGD